MLNVLSHPYLLDKSISNFRVVGCCYVIFIKILKETCVLQRLIWFFTVCRCPIKRTLGLYGLSPPVVFSLAVPRRCFFYSYFLLFVFRVYLCHTFLSVRCIFAVACWGRINLLALFCVIFPCVFSFLIWYPGLGVVLESIDY